jgi:hypothetical protein
MPPEEVVKLSTLDLKEGGVTWEQFGGMLQGPWSAKAWEAIIPTMGYMALLRNLRNFEAAGISKKMQAEVIKTISSKTNVQRSRQLPFRFLSAYKSMNSSTYLQALEDALDYACLNIPEFEGTTLILIDKSASMNSLLSSKSSMQLWEVGALFGAAVATKCEGTDVAIFGDTSKRITIPNGASTLRSIDYLRPNNGVGHGTNIWGSVLEQYEDHDRVVIFTDLQDNWNGLSYGRAWNVEKFSHIPFIHYFDIGGYGQAPPLEAGTTGRYQYGGFSDATFKLMALLETQNAGWPF